MNWLYTELNEVKDYFYKYIKEDNYCIYPIFTNISEAIAAYELSYVTDLSLSKAQLLINSKKKENILNQTEDLVNAYLDIITNVTIYNESKMPIIIDLPFGKEIFWGEDIIQVCVEHNVRIKAIFFNGKTFTKYIS